MKNLAVVAVPRRSRLRRVVVIVGKTTGLVVVGVVALITGAILHVGLRAPRAFATSRINGLLRGTVQGTILIRDVHRVGLDHVGGIDADVYDPSGTRVLTLRGVSARLKTFRLLRSLLSKRRVDIEIPDLGVETAEVLVEDDDHGGFTIADSLSPTPGPPGRGADLILSRVHFAHISISNHSASVPIAEGDIDGLEGSLRSTAEALEVRLAGASLRGRGTQGLDPEGLVSGWVRLPADEGAPNRGSVAYLGRLGEIPVAVAGALDGATVDGTLVVRKTRPEAFNAALPGRLRLGAPVGGLLTAHGEWPTIDAKLSASVGEGTVEATAQIVVPDGARRALELRGAARATGIDAAALDTSAPPSRLTLSVAGALVAPSGAAATASFRVENEAGEFDGQVVPRATIVAAARGAAVSGRATVFEPGAPTTATFSVSPNSEGAPSRVSFTTETTVTDLHAIPRVALPVRGAASLSTHGFYEIESKTVHAQGTARLDHLAAGGVRAETATLEVSVDGPTSAPNLDGELTATNLTSGRYGFRQARASASGSLTDLAVTLGMTGSSQAPDIDAQARIRLGQVAGARTVSIREARANLERDGVQATIAIDSVEIASQTIDVRGARIDGLGDSILLSGHRTPATLVVKAEAPDVDVARVARLLGESKDLHGTASLDLDVSADRRGAQGRVVLDARLSATKGANLDLVPPLVLGGLTLSLPPLGSVTAHVGAQAAGQSIRVSVAVDAERVGKLAIETSDVKIDGPLYELATWLHATGAVSVDASGNLAALVKPAASESAAVLPTAGDVSLHAKLDRSSRDALPNAEIHLSTAHLELEPRTSKSSLIKDEPSMVAPPTLRGIDGALDVTMDGGQDRVTVVADLHDGKGSIATVTGEISPSLRDAFARPGEARQLLARAPINARLVVHEKTIDEWESLLGVFTAASGGAPLRIPLDGVISGGATLSGTIGAPQLIATAEGKHLVAVGPRCPPPIDVRATFRYQDRNGDLRAVVSGASAGAPLLEADASVALNEEPLGAAGPLDWTLSGGVELIGFPLALTSHALRTRVDGTASGTVRLADYHHDASLDANLSLHDLSIGHATPTNAVVKATLRQSMLNASIALHQAKGELQAEASGPMSWGNAAVPTLAGQNGIDVRLKAHDFRADAVRPFVAATFVALDGVIDTDSHIHIDKAPEKSRFEGSVAVRDGVVEIPAVGERFHGIEARLTIDPWGTLRVDHLVAEGPSGKLTASGNAVFDGLTFKTAHADVKIAKDDRIPLSVEGVPVGTAYGKVALDASMASGNRLDVIVDVPSLAVMLPQASGHSVQDLAPNPNVRIGAVTGPTFRPVLLGPPTPVRTSSSLDVHAEVKLGKEIEIKRDTTLDVVLTGDVVLDVKDETRVTGQIQLLRGKLDIEGKQFNIARGTVTFSGDDASNPMVLATAHWDAPDGTRVYADYGGTPKAGKLELHSEPALSQDQIVSLILFGSTSSGFGASTVGGAQGSGDVAAVGLAGGIITQSVNRIISGVTSADITTRIDSSVANNPEPEVVAQLTKTISAHIGYKLGAAAPGDNPDRADLTLDWRFIKNWSLSADVGDQGSAALDVVWRLRY